MLTTTSADINVSKVRSLLEINKTLAKENTFLSQQFDVLSKEAASLSHLLRSRQVLTNAKELELKSALEASKHALKEKDEEIRRLEERVTELEARLTVAVEQRWAMMDAIEAMDAGRRVEEKVEVEDTDKSSTSPESPKSPKSPKSSKSSKSSRTPTTDLAFLEANHPWLSPVLLRLERLSNDSVKEFKVPASKRFSPSDDQPVGRRVDVDIDLTGSSDEDSRDAGSGAYDPHAAFDEFANTNDSTEDAHEQDQFQDQFETPEPVPCRLSIGLPMPSVHETSVLKTPVTGSRSSLRQRKTINYALPSLNAKLRQGDAHTFGSVEFERGGAKTTPRRSSKTMITTKP